jgi:hypothetical protein
MAKHEETNTQQPHSAVVDVEPKANAAESAPASAPKTELKVDQFVVVVVFTGRQQELAIPVASNDAALALIALIDEQRGRFVTVDIDGASVILNPSNIAFMRVENHPSITLQD